MMPKYNMQGIKEYLAKNYPEIRAFNIVFDLPNQKLYATTFIGNPSRVDVSDFVTI